MSRVIAKHCDGCSIGDPSERHHDCIIRNGSYSEWFEYKFEKMLHKVDFYLVYELLKYFLMDSFSIEEIDKSLPFFFSRKLHERRPILKKDKTKTHIELYGGRKSVNDYFFTYNNNNNYERNTLFNHFKPDSLYFV